MINCSTLLGLMFPLIVSQYMRVSRFTSPLVVIPATGGKSCH